MKKKIAIAVVIAGLGLAGLNQAYAGWGARGANYYNCPQLQGGQYSQIDPATQEKMDKFFTDTQDIRKEMAVKQAEKQALLRSENPDPAALGKIAGELFDLRTTLRQKADEAGVAGLMGPQGGRKFAQGNRGIGMGGPGMGGPGKGGRNMGYGMNNSGFNQGRFQ